LYKKQCFTSTAPLSIRGLTWGKFYFKISVAHQPDGILSFGFEF